MVALSSYGAECVAACECAREAVWLRGLLDELGFTQREPTIIYEDNAATICVSKNPCKHDASKHIMRKAAYLRQQVRDKIISLEPIGTKNNLADVLTKSVAISTFQQLTPMLMGEQTAAHMDEV